MSSGTGRDKVSDSTCAWDGWAPVEWKVGYCDSVREVTADAVDALDVSLTAIEADGYRVSVVPRDLGRLGSFSQDLRLVGRDSSSNLIDATRVRVRWDVTDGVECVPSTLNLSTVSTGEAVEKSVRLVASADRLFKLQKQMEVTQGRLTYRVI